MFSLSYDTEHAVARAIFELILVVCGMEKVLKGPLGNEMALTAPSEVPGTEQVTGGEEKKVR